jgi:uncharacterized protein (TIGR03083 family)
VDHAEAYSRSYQRIRSLVDDETAGVEVPTCPGWTVKDVVAHLADFFVVYKSGDPREVFDAGWGDRGVDQRRDRSLQECLEEWSDNLKNPGDLFESHLAPVAVADVLAHEQDIRTALDRPGARDDENIVPSIEMALSFLEQKAAGADLPTLRIVTDDVDRQIGDGEPDATLRVSTYDLFRTLHGRRTVDQMKVMEWSGDPGQWPHNLFIFGPTERVVEE